jgi:thioredoxin reductase
MKWKFENIDVIFTCNEDDFERTSNYSRNKLKTDDKIIIIIDNPIVHVDGSDSTDISTSKHSRNKINTNDRIIIIDGANIDGNDSTDTESDICESSEDIVDTDKHKPRRKATKVSDMPAVLDDNDSIDN